MVQENFSRKDWEIPFMLLELSAYVKRKEAQHQRPQPNKEIITEMNTLFDQGNAAAAMDLFWDNIKVDDG